MWICEKCREEHDDNFDSCWKCEGEETNIEKPTNNLLLLLLVCSIIELILLGFFFGVAEFSVFSAFHMSIFASVTFIPLGILIASSIPYDHFSIWFFSILSPIFMIILPMIVMTGEWGGYETGLFVNAQLFNGLITAVVILISSYYRKYKKDLMIK